MDKQCDIGGDYHYPRIPGPAVYRERCVNLPTYRWRTDEVAPGHWNYRCASHVGLLQRSLPGLVIEPLTKEDH